MPYTTTEARCIGLKQYEEASRDPRGWAPEPGIIIRPFHGNCPGMPELFHVYSERDPEFGFCGEEHQAREAALALGAKLARLDAQS